MPGIGHMGRRRSCPRCSGVELRTLWLCGGARRRHQCMACGHRYSSDRVALAAAGAGTRFGMLHAIAADDRELVESLMVLMIGTGTLVGDVRLSPKVLHELTDEHGPPSATLRGFELPVFSWLVDQVGAHAMHFVAIDQGDVRVCFNVRRRRGYGPL